MAVQNSSSVLQHAAFENLGDVLSCFVIQMISEIFSNNGLCQVFWIVVWYYPQLYQGTTENPCVQCSHLLCLPFGAAI